MGIIFRAIDENYKMPMEFKKIWTTLQNFGQKCDKRIWRNLTYFVDWMEKNFVKEKVFEIIGKTYDLEDSREFLFRFEKNNDNNRSSIDKEENRPWKFQRWLMSNVFPYVENPAQENNPLQKYIGKVRFTKIHVVEGRFEDRVDKLWIPPEKDENGADLEKRAEVDDIEIVVYSDSAMKEERKYEYEHGWKEEWANNQWIKEWNYMELYYG